MTWMLRRSQISKGFVNRNQEFGFYSRSWEAIGEDEVNPLSSQFMVIYFFKFFNLWVFKH